MLNQFGSKYCYVPASATVVVISEPTIESLRRAELHVSAEGPAFRVVSRDRPKREIAISELTGAGRRDQFAAGHRKFVVGRNIQARALHQLKLSVREL